MEWKPGDDARTLVDRAQGTSKAAWIVWKARRELKLQGRIEIDIEFGTPKDESAWVEMALRVLRERPRWRVKKTITIARLRGRTVMVYRYDVRWRGGVRV